MRSNKRNFDIITGRYLLIGNPCTTVPCLPGVAYAVMANDEYYYITIDGHWSSENRSWNGYTPEPGDLVSVTGSLEEQKDAFGKSFHTIEVVSLQPAK
jgi:hypothetical protein